MKTYASLNAVTLFQNNELIVKWRRTLNIEVSFSCKFEPAEELKIYGYGEGQTLWSQVSGKCLEKKSYREKWSFLCNGKSIKVSAVIIKNDDKGKVYLFWNVLWNVPQTLFKSKRCIFIPFVCYYITYLRNVQ